MFDRRPGVQRPVKLSDWMQRRLIRPVWVPFAVFALAGYLGWRLRAEPIRWLWAGGGLAVLLGAASVLNRCWRPHLLAGAVSLLLGVLMSVWPIARADRAAASDQMRSLTGIVLQSDTGADQTEILAQAAGSGQQATRRHQQIVVWTASGKVYLRLTDEPLYQIGDIIRWRTAVRRVAGAGNPGGFETDRWLAGQHVFLEAEPAGHGEAVRPPGFGPMLVRIWAAAGLWGRRVRIWFCGRLLRWMGCPDGAVLCGMLAGVTGLMAPDDLAAFRRAGLAHLFAVSGAHTQIVLSGCLSVLAMAGPSHRLRQWLKLPVLLAFGWVTGWPIPVSRAVLSQVLGLCGVLMRRRTDRLNHLLVSALMILAVRPFAVLQTGFWMSVSVSFALLTIPAADETGWFGRLSDSRPARLPGIRALTAAAAAAAASLPFALMLSAAVPVLSIPANLLALPLAAWMITGGLLLGVVSALPVLPGWLGQALGRAVQLMRLLSGWSARLALTVPDPVRMACLFTLLMVLLIWRRTAGGRLRRRGSACLIALMLLGAVRADAWLSAIWRPPAALTVWFLDVGQGDCILIRCGGRHYLIDCGTERAGNDRVIPALDALGIARIDLAMMSHLDQDHAGGMVPLLETGRVDTLVMPPPLPSARSAALLSAARAGAAAIRTLRRGDVVRSAAGLTFTALWPGTYRDGGNADSLVLRMSLGTFDLLLTGDISDQEERRLLADGQRLNCEMLKVPHHGSRYGSSAAFLAAVTPVCAAIQCGARNRYGHPAAETICRLQAAGSAVFRCDRGGCVVVTVYPDHFKVYNWQQPALVYSYKFEPD